MRQHIEVPLMLEVGGLLAVGRALEILNAPIEAHERL